MKTLEKEEQTKPKARGRKELMKIRVKINDIKNLKNWEKSMEPKLGSLKGPIIKPFF